MSVPEMRPRPRIMGVENASPSEQLEPADTAPLPTMDDLDRLAADLDSIDATLASLDRDVGDVADPEPLP